MYTFLSICTLVVALLAQHVNSTAIGIDLGTTYSCGRQLVYFYKFLVLMLVVFYSWSL